VRQKYQLTELLDGGLDNPVVDDLHEQVDDLVGGIRKLHRLDLLPVVALQ